MRNLSLKGRRSDTKYRLVRRWKGDTVDSNEMPSRDKADTKQNQPGPHEHPREKASNLVTPPTDHRFLKGRY